MFGRYREIQERCSTPEGREDGFTLIELLVVILVLGILAAIVIFAVGSVTTTSARTACNTDAKSLETAIAAYYTTNGTHPTTAQGSTVIVPAYLHSWPTSTHYTMNVDKSGVLWVSAGTNPATTGGIVATGSGTAFDGQTSSTGCNGVS